MRKYFSRQYAQAVSPITPYGSRVPSTFIASPLTASAFHGAAAGMGSWFLAQELGLLALLPLLRGQPSTIVLALALGGAIGLTRARLLLYGTTIFLLCFWLMVAFTPLAANLAQPLKQSDALARVDAVVVLLARIQPDNEFEYHSLARLTRGLELTQAGWAPHLVITQGGPPQGSHQTAAATLLSRLKVRTALHSVGPVLNTHDEAVVVSRLAKQRGWTKILLVTSPTHSRRSALTFSKVGLQVISTPCQETGFDLENLNRPEDRLMAFRSALHEIVGLRVYRTRGWA